MARPSKYPRELRERAVRLVPSPRMTTRVECEAIRVDRGEAGDRVGRDAAQVGASGRGRRRHPAGEDQRGVAEIRELKKENAELRRANEILKAASAFFAAELDRPPRY